MNKNENENNARDLSISIEQIFRIILTYILPILLVTVIAAGAAFTFTKVFSKTKYTTKTQILVKANPQQSSVQVSTSEFNAQKALIKQYSIIIETPDVLKMVSDQLDEAHKVSVSKLKSGLSEYDVDDSGILGISYTDTDRERAEAVIEALIKVAPNQLEEIAEVGKATPLGTPETAVSAPKTVRNALLAAIVGFIGASLVFVLISMLDTRIRTVEDLSETFDITILGSIPTIDANLNNISENKEEDDE